MLKLLQINVTANWGSTGKIAESVGLAALEAGWESYIAYGRWCNPSQSKLIKIGGPLDKYFHYAEQMVRDNEGLCSRGATERFIKQIDAIKPDIVQLHNIHDHYLNYQILFNYLNQTDVKVVWTFHDCWAFTGHCFHFVTKDCMKWKTGCNNCPMKNAVPKTLFDRSKENYKIKKELFGTCSKLTIVAVSDWMAGFVRQSFLMNNRIEVIKNGVDLEVFKPTGEEENDGSFNIIAVSSVWNKEKGLYDIYKLRSILPDTYKITIVGLSQKQVKELPTGIKGVERTQNVEELVGLYSKANVLINPTYADTFPTVNLEAIACGTPVVTYETGGSPEAVDFQTGLVVSQGDIYGMADAVKNICAKGKGYYSEACRKRTEYYFNKNNCFKLYIKLYNQLINNA